MLGISNLKKKNLHLTGGMDCLMVVFIYIFDVAG